MSYKDYTLGNNSVIKWRQSIDGYYKKGLAQFSDARTVRIHLEMCHDWIVKDQAMIDTLKDAGADAGDTMDFIEAFAEERVVMIEIKEELEAWLAARQLAL